VYISICMCVCVCTCVCTCVCVHTYVCVYARMWVYKMKQETVQDLVIDKVGHCINVSLLIFPVGLRKLTFFLVLAKHNVW